MVTPNISSEDTVAAPEAAVRQDGPTNLHDALGMFVADKKSGKSSKRSMEGHQEIIRFIDWYGRDRRIDDLSPSLVEEYAREFSQRWRRGPETPHPGKGIPCFPQEDRVDGCKPLHPPARQPVPADRFGPASYRRQRSGQRPAPQRGGLQPAAGRAGEIQG